MYSVWVSGCRAMLGSLGTHSPVSVAKQEDLTRYMYVVRSTAGGGYGRRAGSVTYKRYALSGDKSIDSIFFPQKAALLRLLDHFKYRLGKFSIPSYPKKVTLLLHGSPGTGKTSLIKALAERTNRHIVNIPLARIKTNQELMDVVFDQCYQVQDNDLPLRHKFDKIVYVMEDIDCASEVVFARNPASKDVPGASDKPSTNDTDLATLNTLLTEHSASGTLTQDMLYRLRTSREASLRVAGEDALNLAGLLNVLDGVVDCPDRIVVMTTNHPEKLDPALIRPGRVNLTIHLGYIQPSEAIEMLTHFFQCEVTAPMRASVENSLNTAVRTFTPAEMEQLCCEYDTLDDVLAALKTAAARPKEVLSAHQYTVSGKQVPKSSSLLEKSDSCSSFASDFKSPWDSGADCNSIPSDEENEPLEKELSVRDMLQGSTARCLRYNYNTLYS